ncbi:MAG: FAD-dependent oxidoreductase [Desulfobacterales bacterium]|nr:FAD-dependent oxidoreductase [Desulfobacterales bacterium]
MNRKIGKALVVGAGVSGIRAALDLAETGYGVTLIDRAPHIGGVLSQLDSQFPTNHCGMCKMLPLVRRDASSQFCLRKGLFHENIEILLSTELTSVEGEPGQFQVTLKENPTWVDPELCMGCGLCETVCPVEAPHDFNQGLTNRKAIYLPVPHAIPNPYVIDLASCSRCGACEEICPTHAVKLSDDKRKAFRILVVDDELIVRDSMKELLLEEGFSVEMAGSGQEALEMLANGSYNLMLTDIKMPEMDGVELLEKAREVAPDLSTLMMTAYATVETAVEAMKIGALDYLIKPFEPEVLIPKVLKVYQDLDAAMARRIEVGAIVMCGGVDYFKPEEGKNIFGYGINPGVVTSIEFERMLSGAGPSPGKLIRPRDGKPIRRIAWIQCVGSRDLQTNADFCSSICCMYAIKEALLAREAFGEELETTIFYMDMRTYEKPFQRYRDQAETEKGVRFVRGRVHSVQSDEEAGELTIRYAAHDGACPNEVFDMLVLPVGQRPAAGVDKLAETMGCELTPHGFVKTEPFAPTLAGKEGVMAGGSFSGLKDISESLIHASAAAASAGRVIHAAGGSLADESYKGEPMRDVSREEVRTLVAICTCGSDPPGILDVEELSRGLERDSRVNRVVSVDRICTAEGWGSLTEMVEGNTPNRVLIGACHPYVFQGKLRELSRRTGLDAGLMDVVDLTEGFRHRIQEEKSGDPAEKEARQSNLRMGLARLTRVDPGPEPEIAISRNALVVGGGIAGMKAALAIAGHGWPVDLVERESALGGNLLWLRETLEGESLKELLADTVQEVEKHPKITLHMETEVTGSFGRVGQFFTTIRGKEGALRTIEHGAVILAAGGSEAETASHRRGESPAILTQKELDEKLADGGVDPANLGSVVMIQCVDSREEPRNYCSRICCASTLKNALHLKKKNPDVAIYVLYRDMMTYGFAESYFTEARKAGVIFIQYDPENKPEVRLAGEEGGAPARVHAQDPILGMPVEIEADLVVLAAGVTPNLPKSLAEAFGAALDQDGFFQEAEFKWRPVDAVKEGVFACGLNLSPRNVKESIASAEAAAQRSLRILAHDRLPAGRTAATVRHALCALCERCIDVCPYGARALTPERDKVIVNAAMCQGCGMCAATCPNSASVVLGFTEPRVMDMIDAALGSLR